MGDYAIDGDMFIPWIKARNQTMGWARIQMDQSRILILFFCSSFEYESMKWCKIPPSNHSNIYLCLLLFGESSAGIGKDLVNYHRSPVCHLLAPVGWWRGLEGHGQVCHVIDIIIARHNDGWSQPLALFCSSRLDARAWYILYVSEEMHILYVTIRAVRVHTRSELYKWWLETFPRLEKDTIGF